VSRIETLKSFIAQRPDDPFPKYALALEYKNAARLEEAREAFEVLVAAHPAYTPAYLHAGNTLVALGRVADARAVYQRGIEACARAGDAHARGELEGALGTLPAP
jgi:tetratricopeptide (TPR) repeat protein